jgi:(1->4)-alpha-D-glucan 1-alpha-D-glucosylmutase
MRLQQYTSPVAAKGMEDTAFYRYARLLSLNEVGGTPEHPTASIEDFHKANVERQLRWPHSMLASSTHDTKRSEDVRARLHVLSEIPSEWRRQVELWTRINDACNRDEQGGSRIDRDTEYFLYQTLVGAWPLAPPGDGPRTAAFCERIAAYMIKSAKEAKRRTSWLNPDPLYEERLQEFVSLLLDRGSNAAFMAAFLPFQKRVARLGLYNGLSQLLLKLTCPGVPDLYQGSELWRFDLVDPDNRRPVDFARRTRLLDTIREACHAGRGGDIAVEFMNAMEDGRAKLFLSWRALAVRRDYAAVFQSGAYVPLAVSGEHAAHVCAFARTSNGIVVVVAVLRWFAALMDSEGSSLDVARLAGTSIDLPSGDLSFIDGITGRPVEPAGRAHVDISDLFSPLPVALWIGVPQHSERNRRQL